jgi:hypothetical protein
VIDNDYSIWRAFRNQYWPASVLLDPRGRTRHTQFGEGEYAKSEQAIQRALSEAGVPRCAKAIVRSTAAASRPPLTGTTCETPETYVGYERSENFASPDAASAGPASGVCRPGAIGGSINGRLAGEWTMGTPATVLNKASGQIAFRFHARDVHLVMGPSRPGKPGSVSRDDGWTAAGCCARPRRSTRAVTEWPCRPATLSADPATDTHRRSNVRDRVPRRRRREVLVTFG